MKNFSLYLLYYSCNLRCWTTSFKLIHILIQALHLFWVYLLMHVLFSVCLYKCLNLISMWMNSVCVYMYVWKCLCLCVRKWICAYWEVLMTTLCLYVYNYLVKLSQRTHRHTLEIILTVGWTAIAPDTCQTATTSVGLTVISTCLQWDDTIP